MPTYTYRCKACSGEFDELQKISEKPLTVCPSCHAHSLVKLIGGGGGVVFKGSGFYSTDYKRSGTVHSRKAEKGEAADGTKHEKKPEAKPEKKSEKKPEK